MIDRLWRGAGPRVLIAFAGPVLLFANPGRAASPDISVSPASLSFKYLIGSALPAAQNLQIKSTGAALNFTLSVSGPLPYSAQWLSPAANSGTTTAAVKIYVNPSGLPAGSYTGTIVISAPGAATQIHNVPVTLDVGDAPATLTASSTSLTFAWVSGQALPADQPITLISSGGALTASITVSGGSWLKASPSGSVALVGLPQIITVSADPTGMAPGTYNAKITCNASTSANKTVTIGVTLNVTAGVPTVTNVWPPGALINSPSTTVTLTGTNYFGNSSAAIGATALTTTVVSPTAMMVAIPDTMMTAAGNLQIVITTPTAASPSAAATFVVYPPGPQIWAVTNSASYTSSLISPGGIITIYGVGLGPATLSVYPGTDPVPTALPTSGAQTSVTIDGKAAPLLYTSETQVSCIVPYAVASKSGTKVDLVLSYNNQSSSAFKVSVIDVDPGVFTLDASGTGQGAILNFNSTTGDYTVNGPANAATKGSTVVIYITGSGQTNPAGNELNLISGVVKPVANVTLTIDGQPATVQGAQAPVGSVPGVLQINATVPSNTRSGNSIPVVVTVGATPSQTRVTMAVK
jgi:uncharacterized protein (TIGR03437 family)